MRVRVLRAVSMPATMFFAPLGPAAGNICFHFFTFMFYSGVNGEPFNPLIMFSSASIIHFVIAAWGIKEPHLTSILPAWSRGVKPTHNLQPLQGKNKYVP